MRARARKRGGETETICDIRSKADTMESDQDEWKIGSHSTVENLRNVYAGGSLGSMDGTRLHRGPQRYSI